MHSNITFRPATTDDMAAAYAVFRRSIFDYLFRLGMVSEAEAKDPPIESAWTRQASWIEHLWNSAAENWVAIDSENRLIGWAMSILRDDHLELTHFFVEPGIQGKGIGRGLITRAFPDGRARHKSIIATQDAKALSLYLRSGADYVTTSVDILVKPYESTRASGLVFERIDAKPAAIAAMVALELEVLGFRREVDLDFLLRTRPAWIGRRDGKAVAYAFGVQPNPPGISDFPPSCGPMACLDPADMPALIDHVAANAEPGEEFYITVPFSNRNALHHLLAQGGKIDPFYLKILADDPAMRLDRYIHTSPTFIL